MSSDTRKRAASAPVSTPDTPPTKVPAPDAATPDPDATIPSKQEVDDIVQQLLSHADADGKHAHESLTRIRELIEEKRDELTNFHCNYLFFGKQGAGKSRLINRILHPEGKGECPMPTSDGSTSVTSVIIRIRRSEAFSVTVHFQDSSQPIPELARIAERHQAVSSMNDLTAALTEMNDFLRQHKEMQESIRFLDVLGDFPLPANISLFDLPGAGHLDPDGIHKSLLDEVVARPSVLIYLTKRLYDSTNECPAVKFMQRYPRLATFVNAITEASKDDVDQLRSLRSRLQEKVEESSGKLFDSLSEEACTFFFTSNLARTVRNAQVFLAGKSFEVHETIVDLFQSLQRILETDLTQDLLGLALGYATLREQNGMCINKALVGKYEAAFLDAWRAQTIKAVESLSGLLAERTISQHTASLCSLHDSSDKRKKAWKNYVLGQIGDAFYSLREIVVGNHRDALAISAVNMALKPPKGKGSHGYITSWTRNAGENLAPLDLLISGSHSITDGVRSICQQQGVTGPINFEIMFRAARILNAHALVQLRDFYKAAGSVRLDIPVSPPLKESHQEEGESEKAKNSYQGGKTKCKEGREPAASSSMSSESQLSILQTVDRIWEVLESTHDVKRGSIERSCEGITWSLVSDMRCAYEADLLAPTQDFFNLLSKFKSTEATSTKLTLPHFASLSSSSSSISFSASSAPEKAESYLRAIHSSIENENVTRFLDAFDTLKSINGALDEDALVKVLKEVDEHAVCEAKDIRKVAHPFVLIKEEEDSQHDDWSVDTHGGTEEMDVDGQVEERAAKLQEDRSVRLRTSCVDDGIVEMRLSRTSAATAEIKNFLERSAKRRSPSADRAPIEDMLIYPTFNILANRKAVQAWQPLWYRGIYAPKQTASKEDEKGEAAACTSALDRTQDIKWPMTNNEKKSEEEEHEAEEETLVTDDDIFRLDLVVCLAHLEKETREKVNKMKTPCILVVVGDLPEFLHTICAHDSKLEAMTTRFLLDVASSLAAHFEFPFWWLVPLDSREFMLLRRSTLKNALCSPSGALLHVQSFAEALEKRFLQSCSQEHVSMLDAIKHHFMMAKNKLSSTKLSQFQLVLAFGMRAPSTSTRLHKVSQVNVQSSIQPSLVTPMLFNTCATPFSTFLRAVEPSSQLLRKARYAMASEAQYPVDCDLRNAVHLMFIQRGRLVYRTKCAREAVLIIDSHVAEVHGSFDSIVEDVDQDEN